MKVLAIILSLLIGTNLNHSDELNGSKNFATFLSQFEKVEQVPTLDQLHLEQLRDDYQSDKSMPNYTGLNNKYIGSKALKISRFSPPTPKPIYRFYPTEKTIATIYTTRFSFSEESIDVYVQLFDLRGNKIEDAKLLAKINPHETQTCSFLSLNEYVINNYKNVWSQPIESFGMADNQILNYELLTKEQHHLVNPGA